MRYFILSVCFVLVSAVCSHDNPHEISLFLEEGERWWTGVIADAHLFPLHEDSDYAFDFFGDTKGNQGNPC